MKKREPSLESKHSEKRREEGRAALQSLGGRNQCRKERRGAKFGGGHCVTSRRLQGNAKNLGKLPGFENDWPEAAS